MADFFEKTHCADQDACLHKDPRHLLFAHQSPARRFSQEKGLRLSRTRAEILESLIPHDPQRAIELAVSPERIRNLPPAIRENMENWHVTQADLKAVHVCFNHKSPEGRIKRWVTLPDGRTFEAFVYGDRRFLPTVSKLAISGISLGEKFAVSEKPYRIVGPLPDEKLLIQYAGSELIIDQGLRSQSIRPENSGSRSFVFANGTISDAFGCLEFGGTNLLHAKYELITTPMTWADANRTAFDKKGRIVCIDSSTENNIVYQLLKDAKKFGVLPDGLSSSIFLDWSY